MRATKRVLQAALAGTLLLALPLSSVAAAGATVIIERGGSSCGLGAGDIPGLPGFDLTSSTVVITSTAG